MRALKSLRAIRMVRSLRFFLARYVYSENTGELGRKDLVLLHILLVLWGSRCEQWGGWNVGHLYRFVECYSGVFGLFLGLKEAKVTYLSNLGVWGITWLGMHPLDSPVSVAHSWKSIIAAKSQLAGIACVGQGLPMLPDAWHWILHWNIFFWVNWKWTGRGEGTPNFASNDIGLMFLNLIRWKGVSVQFPSLLSNPIAHCTKETHKIIKSTNKIRWTCNLYTHTCAHACIHSFIHTYIHTYIYT